MSNSFTYTQARANLAKILNKVAEDNEVVIINRKNAENVALISEKELSGLIETAHLLRSPANAKRLLEALKESRRGKAKPMTVEVLKKKFGLE